MKKLIWGLVIVAVVAVFGGRAWYLHKQAEQNKDAIKIGVVVPLSGFDENMTNRIVTTLRAASLSPKVSPAGILVGIPRSAANCIDGLAAFRAVGGSDF